MTSTAPLTALPKPCLKQTFGVNFNSQQKHAHFPPASEEAKRYSGRLVCCRGRLPIES